MTTHATSTVFDTPTAKALLTAKSKDASNTEIQKAHTHILGAVKPAVRGTVKKWSRNPLVARVHEKGDIAQDCQMLVLTKIVAGFKIPDDIGEDDERLRKILGRYTVVCLANHWRDRLRHIERNGTLQPVHEQSIGGDDAMCFVDALLGGEEDESSECEPLGILRGRLGDSDFNICYLRYQGLSTTQIGEVVGLSRKGVQDRIRLRIRPVLGPLLEKCGYTVP